MTIMNGYTGYWERHLTFSPTPEDEAAFLHLDLLSVLIEGRTVVIFEDKDGSVPQRLERDRNAGLGLKYEWSIGDRPWARWIRSLTEMTIEVRPDGSDDETLTFEVAPDHELPWPMLQFLQAADDTAVAKREVGLRFMSAFKAGGEECLKQVIRGMPRSFRGSLTPTIWMYLIHEAQEQGDYTNAHDDRLGDARHPAGRSDNPDRGCAV